MSEVEAINRRLNAIVSWAAKMAPVAGPLAGMAVAVKANIDVAGLATTAGMAHRRHAFADEDAPLVARLRAAGAVVLGHANMDEAALGAVTDNPFWGRTENPWRRGRTAGGSSGGSAAAVAGGFARLALGTDTLGSVRIPASYTGIFGLKPGPGVLTMAGVVPLAQRLDVPGLLAASLEDLKSGWSVLHPGQHAAPVRRIMVLAEVLAAPMSPVVRTALETVCLAARARGKAVETRPFAGLSLPHARQGGFREAVLEARTRFGHEPVSPRLARWFEKAPDTQDETDTMARVHDVVRAALETADVLILPTTPQTAFPHAEVHADQADFCALANIAGIPALSFPAGVDMDGMPVGVQIMGRPDSETTLMALAGELVASSSELRRKT